MSFRIGDLVLKNGLLLAPMAGVTDYAFRRLCRRFGAEMTVSEMVSAKAMHYRDEKTAALARIRADEIPMAVQIFGAEPEILAEAAAALTTGRYRGCVSEAVPVAIDINMGCPVRKVVTNGEGSALMKKPELVYDIVRTVKAATFLPVSVKLRAGWSDGCKNAVEVALAAEEGGASFVTVHGRTREQLYRPPVDLSVIASVKEALSIPVIGNGGIMTVADALTMKQATGCDGLMIARGAMGRPWLFGAIAAALCGKEYHFPSFHEQLSVAREHLSLLCEDKGETVGVREARTHLAAYVTGFAGAAAFRGALNRAATRAEILARLDELEASLLISGDDRSGADADGTA